MTTLTTTQLDALDFYAANEQYVTYFGLTNLDREDRLFYRKGKKLMQSALDIKTSRSYQKYQDSEVIFLVETYVNCDGNMHSTRDAFFKAYPDTAHSLSSVYMKISRIRTLDNQYVNDTEWQTDNQVKSACQSVDPNRFN
jgi:hypothetical protein